MRQRTILFFLFCYFPFASPYGQSNEYIFSHLAVANGLSNNHITRVYKDARGFMWFGTISGLNRYDGYQFKIYKHDQRDSTSIGDNYIDQIFEGPENKLWIECRAGRFNIYDPASDRFDRNYFAFLRKWHLPDSWLLSIIKGKNGFWFVYQDKGVYHYTSDGKIIAIKNRGNGSLSMDGCNITDAKEDADGDLWVLHEHGALEKIDGHQNIVVDHTDLLEKEFGNNPILCNLYIDGQNDCWLSSNGVFKGAYCYNTKGRTLRHFSQDVREGGLSSNIVYGILQDARGLIWLSTDHGGVNILDKKDFSVKHIGHIEDDGKSIASNSITTTYRDQTGTIWLGTFKNGISYYHQNLIQFPQYNHQPLNPSSLSYDDVNGFVEDSAGKIWIASNGGGLIYFDRKRGIFRQYLHDPKQANSLCNDIIVSMLVDKKNRLWIGTYFGGLDCYDGRTFTHYRHDDHIPTSLSDDRVMYLFQDSDQQLWIGTIADGMDRFDPSRNIFYHYNSNSPNSIHNNYVSSITEDAQHNLWIATGYGIDVFEKSTGQFVHYSSDNSHLSSDNVISVFKDSHQRLWAGTREGLDLWNPEKKNFQSFLMEDGLPDNTIRSIVEDSRHDIWVSTPNGLSKIKTLPLKNSSGFRIQCKNYHEQDGLQGREFNERAGYSTRDGYLLFGGPNGFNYFDPAHIVNNRTTPPIVLTDLEIFDKSVHPGESTDGHVILSKALTETDAITLHSSDKVFSIAFASLDFIDNGKSKYAYQLVGFDKNWLTTDGKARKATYTNLDAGTYTFKVKAADEDGDWNDKEASLKIIVLPPFWKTSFAYVLYILVLAVVLYVARRMVIQRARVRFALEHERQEARRMHEMDLMKIRFFTNMSHELRTPLSLILAPVEKLIHHPQQPDPKKQYEVIRRNARRLLHLVNQLLDFRKMEVNELRLHLQQGDVLKFIKDISWSFIDLAERKNISFTYDSGISSLLTLFDADKLERILFNLLSNAFKFTPENGHVRVEVTAEKTRNEEVILQIKVKDTGIGIQPEKQARIFDRFFQADVPDAILNQGSGIGLSITQEFVKMHNGRLSVESEVNKGSCFMVTLPFKELSDQVVEASPDEPRDIDAAGNGFELEKNRIDDEKAAEMAPGAQYPRKSTILIVEDSEDFRFYLKDNLQRFYTILEASDGKEGWRKALAEHPDLIVSDISMPMMNGIELCRKIGADERTCQIPVILLTAMAGEGSELKGLQTGAIDYIIKPFNFELLLSKVRNVLAHTDSMKKTYQRQVQAAPAPLQIPSADDAFVQQVLEHIEKNMGNPDLSVGELSVNFHASRSTFYKRLLLLTGKTPIEFIRHIRLKRAAELLEKSQLTISEIAYTVGFNNPKNFSQYFKMEFDRIPSAYRSEKKGKQV